MYVHFSLKMEGGTMSYMYSADRAGNTQRGLFYLDTCSPLLCVCELLRVAEFNVTGRGDKGKKDEYIVLRIHDVDK